MNNRYISENFDLTVFLTEMDDAIVDWHYSTDEDLDKPGSWDAEPNAYGGNAGVYFDAIHAINDGINELPDICTAMAEDPVTHTAGPELILIDWPIFIHQDGWCDRMFSVHIARDGGLEPPLPKVLADRLAVKLSEE